MNANIPF